MGLRFVVPEAEDPIVDRGNHIADDETAYKSIGEPDQATKEAYFITNKKITE